MARRRFVLKGDVKKFFPSIDHEILKGELRRVVADEAMLSVLDRVIDSSNPQEPVQEWYPGDDLFSVATRRRGIPIGNLTSQFFANVFLDRVDHIMMDRLGCGEYIRYCDDFLVFGDDCSDLWAVREAASQALTDQRLTLHERKGGVHRTSSPVPFLGFTLRGSTRRLQRASLVRATRRLRGYAAGLRMGAMSSEAVAAGIAAWVGHARYATNPGLVSKVLARAGVDSR